MKNLEVVMLGNTQMGKTSMLSAMSMELQSVNSKSLSCSLQSTDEEFRALHDKWVNLGKEISCQEGFTVLKKKLDPGMKCTEHPFEFSVSRKKKFGIAFVDTKGGLTAELNKELQDRVAKAFGVICAIDASILMRCDDAVNDEWNCPKKITQFFMNVFAGEKKAKPEFVLFVLTKSETFMRKNDDRENLLSRFREKYDDVVSILKQAKEPIKTYLLAVQTMGCVSVSRIDKETKLPVFRVEPNNGLKPVDCAYPLVLVMKNLLWKLDKGVLRTIFGPIMELLKIKRPIKEYLAELDKVVPKPLLFEELI